MVRRFHVKGTELEEAARSRRSQDFVTYGQGLVHRYLVDESHVQRPLVQRTIYRLPIDKCKLFTFFVVSSRNCRDCQMLRPLTSCRSLKPNLGIFALSRSGALSISPLKSRTTFLVPS